ncbi:hypothetical protein PI27_gp202 [Listeria phage WIL-1]|nr:hypothetical protein PI27_gp202 [Listeria phage WIL-1]
MPFYVSTPVLFFIYIGRAKPSPVLD